MEPDEISVDAGDVIEFYRTALDAAQYELAVVKARVRHLIAENEKILQALMEKEGE